MVIFSLEYFCIGYYFSLPYSIHIICVCIRDHFNYLLKSFKLNDKSIKSKIIISESNYFKLKLEINILIHICTKKSIDISSYLVSKNSLHIHVLCLFVLLL